MCNADAKGGHRHCQRYVSIRQFSCCLRASAGCSLGPKQSMTSCSRMHRGTNLYFIKGKMGFQPGFDTREACMPQLTYSWAVDLSIPTKRSLRDPRKFGAGSGRSGHRMTSRKGRPPPVFPFLFSVFLTFEWAASVALWMAQVTFFPLKVNQ